MKIGYARVSTAEQDAALQVDALNKAGCDRVFTDTVTGSKYKRPGLDHALDMLRPHDTLVIWRLDRLGRTMKELLELVQTLEQANIALASLQENIDTNSPSGKLTFHLFAALAEFERNLIRERTNAGLTAAKARGRKGGRPAALDAQQIKEINILLKNREITVAEVAKRYGVSRGTVYNYCHG